jgi:hypothetical protein
MIYCNDRPFPVIVVDDCFPRPAIEAAADSFDAVAEWVRYDSVLEAKRTTRRLTPECAALMTAMQVMCPADLATDATLHGGGMHEIQPGGWLSTHLDCDRHPVSGYRRAWNAILYLTTCEGGELELREVPTAEPTRIDAVASRLVLFETSDTSWHGVATVNGTIARRSLACYWWDRSIGPTTRPRALFAGDDATLIRQRAGL